MQTPIWYRGLRNRCACGLPCQSHMALECTGPEFNRVFDMIFTHFHPDHVYGVPNFLAEDVTTLEL